MNGLPSPILPESEGKQPQMRSLPNHEVVCVDLDWDSTGIAMNQLAMEYHFLFKSIINVWQLFMYLAKEVH
jgi:hypothetical protein